MALTRRWFEPYGYAPILLQFYPWDFEDELDEDGTIVSEELWELIHDLSGWAPFDIRQVKEIDAMEVQVQVRRI